MSRSDCAWLATTIVMIGAVTDAPAQLTARNEKPPAVADTIASPCGGDCDGDGSVDVSELTAAIGIGLGSGSIETCQSADEDSSGTVDVGELVVAVQHALEGCPETGALFVIRACASPDDPDGQTFHALIRDPAVIAQADDLVGAGQQQILSGTLLAEDGGFNAPWSWHLHPDTIGFSDFTIELCDGCPSFVEADLDYWLERVGTYCPWSTEVVERER